MSNKKKKSGLPFVLEFLLSSVLLFFMPKLFQNCCHNSNESNYKNEESLTEIGISWMPSFVMLVHLFGSKFPL